jgi:hypothetical protein
MWSASNGLAMRSPARSSSSASTTLRASSYSSASSLSKPHFDSGSFGPIFGCFGIILMFFSAAVFQHGFGIVFSCFRHQF